ncbi:uncharacterized protein LOC111404596 [Olea europaea var. sylvestris]|uniref:uncharacterized protein LOC111404596 n=1 Tax=Olea europaea var. sylvestris TaxID=158386 RepID=UPI000C1CD3C1|nr:uncharacterized protein LOC111404596 [Olea europaea var. sylvestris]
MRKCPNHGITQGNQVQYFYTGLTPLSKSQVDASAGGSIIGKSVQQTMDLFELIATTHSMFSSERAVQPKAARMCELDSTTSTNAQIAALTKQVELLGKLQTHGANAMMASSACENCGNHATESCMMLTSSEDQQERRPSLGEMFQQYVQKTDKVFQQIDTNFQNQQASIKKLETQIGQTAQQLAEHPQGTLLGNTIINPKEQLMTIKEVENDLPRAPVKVKAYVPPLSFPQRLRKKSMEQNIHIINTKSEVQSPEITTERPKRKDDQEVIDEPTRVEKSAPNATENGESTETLATKAPKMLTKKRKLPKFETVALTEESSARVHRKLPPKLKDPRSFTLPISIGNSYSIHALCDTGAIINLMSYSAYRKFGLDEVNSKSITLQLADRTITRPCGKFEDVLVKVGNLIFPVDFIVLDIPEDRDIPIILGRSF